MTLKYLAPWCAAFALLASWPAAADIDAIIKKIDRNQSAGVYYMLTPEEIWRLERSADPVAHYYLGLVYAEGDTPNTPRDQCLAARHMHRSAMAGYPFAQLYMGYAHAFGIGVKVNRNAAYWWLNEGTRALVEAKVKAEPISPHPYNYDPPETLLEDFLNCATLYGDQRENWTVESMDSLASLDYAKPCIRSNVPFTLKDEVTGPSGSPTPVDSDESFKKLLWYCTPKLLSWD